MDDFERAFTFGEWIAAVGIDDRYTVNGLSSVTEDEDDGRCSCGDYLDHRDLDPFEREQYEFLKRQRDLVQAQLDEIEVAITNIEARS